MTDTDALHDKIARADAEARDAFHAMWRAMNEGTPDEYQAALADWRQKTAYRDGLQDAGFIVEVGPITTAGDN